MEVIEDYIHRENAKKVMALAGTGGFMSREELTEMRELELKEQAKQSSDK